MGSDASIAIIDCGLGNHASVLNALTLLGFDALVTSDSATIATASHLILPGVGSFKEGMKGLHDRNLIPLIRMEVLKKKKPLLGICLGMQLLASEGFEYGHHEGLGFIPGKVVEVDVTQSHLRLPHIGWNDVRIVGDHLVACNFTIPPVFYFVHSFQFVPQDASVIAGVTDYGGDIVAILQSGNICGVQFHPEKSHEDGLKIFKNFLTL